MAKMEALSLLGTISYVASTGSQNISVLRTSAGNGVVYVNPVAHFWMSKKES